METDAADRLKVALALLREMRSNRAIAPAYKQDVLDVLSGQTPRRFQEPTTASPPPPDNP